MLTKQIGFTAVQMCDDPPQGEAEVDEGGWYLHNAVKTEEGLFHPECYKDKDSAMDETNPDASMEEGSTPVKAEVKEEQEAGAAAEKAEGGDGAAAELTIEGCEVKQESPGTGLPDGDVPMEDNENLSETAEKKNITDNNDNTLDSKQTVAEDMEEKLKIKTEDPDEASDVKADNDEVEVAATDEEAAIAEMSEEQDKVLEQEQEELDTTAQLDGVTGGGELTAPVAPQPKVLVLLAWSLPRSLPAFVQWKYTVLRVTGRRGGASLEGAGRGGSSCVSRPGPRPGHLVILATGSLVMSSLLPPPAFLPPFLSPRAVEYTSLEAARPGAVTHCARAVHYNGVTFYSGAVKYSIAQW
jgi:hypothetical protein